MADGSMMAPKCPRKILFVGMCNSIHLARWVEMASHTRHQLAIFPVYPAKPHARLRELTVYYPALDHSVAPELSDVQSSVHIESIPTTFENLGGSEHLSLPELRLGESDQTAPFLFGPAMLAAAITHFQPDIIHSLEFQHAGYLVLRARDYFARDEFPFWLATNWGSDVFYYRQFTDHARQINRLLTSIDLYSCECTRDIKLAMDLGYDGPLMPVFPNTGGFDIEQVSELRGRALPSRRKRIMIKGYQHFAGRALTSLAVLERFADRLKDYEIVLYSMGEAPYQKAKDLEVRGLLRFCYIGYADHDEMLENFSQSRIYMGISISDAISTSVLEAMATGCFPIQTDTSCCDEWFKDGVGGFIVKPDDFEMICARFERALADDQLVDSAARANWNTVKTRLDENVISQSVQDFYSRAFRILDKSAASRCKHHRDVVAI